VLTKTDKKTGEVLQGAVFELQDKDGKVLQSGLTTDASGKLALKGLEPGEYQLVETKAPVGYDLDETPVSFTIEKGQKAAVEVNKTNKSIETKPKKNINNKNKHREFYPNTGENNKLSDILIVIGVVLLVNMITIIVFLNNQRKTK
ncbi:prealbumin-like fold domain-containing protein, partial [Enterococcus faecalis]